jgi:hypothetical protein
MNFQPPDSEDLQERVLKLEKQNHRFKQLGVAGLIVPALLLVMGQAPSKKTVEANEFILRDDSGNVRARLEVDKGVAQLLLFDPDGSEKIGIDSGTVGGKDMITLSGASVMLHHNSEFGLLVPDTLVMTSAAEQTSGMELGRGGLRVTDVQGFSASFGVTDLVTPRTGETHKTSAASLVLFDKEKNVIWKAP